MSPPPDRIFRETAFFDDLDSASLSFAFELAAPSRTALRLEEIAEALAGQGRKWKGQARHIRPADRSGPLFLDDVTTGPPGTNGRPLFFAASGSGPDDESRKVALCRPERWTYEFEGETTELVRSARPSKGFAEDTRQLLRLRKRSPLLNSHPNPTLRQPAAARRMAVIEFQQLPLLPSVRMTAAILASLGQTPQNLIRSWASPGRG